MVDYDMIVKTNQENRVPYPLIIIVGNEVIRVKGNEDNSSADTMYIRDHRICNKIIITEIKSDDITHEKICVLKYVNSSGHIETHEAMADILSDTQKCIQLSKYGVDVDSINCKSFIMHMKNQMKMARINRVTSEMGFHIIDNQTIFIGSQSFTYTEKKIIPSEIAYHGKLSVCESGSYSAYKELLEKYIVPSTFLSTALAVGGSSLLVGYLWRELQIPNIMVQLSGDSSTGKSTAMMVALSLYGGMTNTNDKTSLFSSWNTTDNAMFEMLSGNYGIAVGFDEVGMSKNKKFASIIYRTVEGKEKQRLEYGVGNRMVREWHTTIISTGEIPLEDDTDQATGQKVRLMHFSDVPWTESPEHSETIKQVIQRNYGFLGNKVASKILQIGKEKLMEIHGKESERIAKKLDCGSLNKRIANQLALIVISARIINTQKYEIDIKQMRAFLCDVLNNHLGENEALAERAYEKLKAEVARRTNQIELRSTNGRVKFSVEGFEVWACSHSNLDNLISITNISIPKTTLDSFFRDNGFQNTQTIYNAWAEIGYLYKDSQGGIIHRVQIGGVDRVKCLKVKL